MAQPHSELEKWLMTNVILLNKYEIAGIKTIDIVFLLKTSDVNFAKNKLANLASQCGIIVSDIRFLDDYSTFIRYKSESIEKLAKLLEEKEMAKVEFNKKLDATLKNIKENDFKELNWGDLHYLTIHDTKQIPLLLPRECCDWTVTPWMQFYLRCGKKSTISGILS